MKFREHRGSLADSMATCVELADRAALVEHVEKLHADFIHGYDFSNLRVKPYFMQHDLPPDDPEQEPIIDWPLTYIIILDGYGVVGFADSP